MPIAGYGVNLKQLAGWLEGWLEGYRVPYPRLFGAPLRSSSGAPATYYKSPCIPPNPCTRRVLQKQALSNGASCPDQWTGNLTCTNLDVGEGTCATSLFVENKCR